MTKRLTKTQLAACTAYLRAHPEKQFRRALSLADGSQMCCLGAICTVLGVPSKPQRSVSGIETLATFDFGGIEDAYGVKGWVAEMLGDSNGSFEALGMPNMAKPGKTYREAGSLAYANDMMSEGERVFTWLDIADHLDKFYPAVEG